MSLQFGRPERNINGFTRSGFNQTGVDTDDLVLKVDKDSGTVNQSVVQQRIRQRTGQNLLGSDDSNVTSGQSLRWNGKRNLEPICDWADADAIGQASHRRSGLSNRSLHNTTQTHEHILSVHKVGVEGNSVNFQREL